MKYTTWEVSVSQQGTVIIALSKEGGKWKEHSVTPTTARRIATDMLIAAANAEYREYDELFGPHLGREE